MIYLRLLLAAFVAWGFVSLWTDIKNVLWDTNPVGVVLTAFIFFDTMIAWVSEFLKYSKLP